MIGITRIHCKVYRREREYFEQLSSGQIDQDVENQVLSGKTMKIVGHAQHYKEIYRLHNTEVQDFFLRQRPDALHTGTLEDPDKWRKLGNFLGLEVPDKYDSHENASPG